MSSEVSKQDIDRLADAVQSVSDRVQINSDHILKLADAMQENTKMMLEAMNSMYDSLNKKIDQRGEQSESRIMTYVENGVEKRLDMLFEKVDSVDQRLCFVEQDVKEIKEKLTEHDDELYTLRRVK